MIGVSMRVTPIALVWLAYLLFCLVVTWVWFGGREGKENDKR